MYIQKGHTGEFTNSQKKEIIVQFSKTSDSLFKASKAFFDAEKAKEDRKKAEASLSAEIENSQILLEGLKVKSASNEKYIDDQLRDRDNNRAIIYDAIKMQENLLYGLQKKVSQIDPRIDTELAKIYEKSISEISGRIVSLAEKLPQSPIALID